MSDEQQAGDYVPIVWQGRRVSAFVPALLADRDLALTSTTVRRAAAAAADVAAGAAAMPADYLALARLLLRAEGVASSYIEGIAAPLADVVISEAALVGATSGPAAWVAANLAAVTEAVDAAHGAPLTVGLLCDWHRTLMAGSPLPGRYVGVIRDEQGWIGGSSPLDAALVTPPPDRLDALLTDLVEYANRDDEHLDPIVQAAVAHAQFETIHPFGDGNGRVGRVLVSWVVTRRLRLVTPPPISTRIAADRHGYLAGLGLFRLGSPDAWVRWFADTVSGAGRVQRELVRQVDVIRRDWRTRLAGDGTGRTVRRDALAWQVLDLLPAHLLLTAPGLAALTGQHLRTVQKALGTLVDVGVLAEHTPTGPRPVGRPTRLYISPDLLALAGTSPRAVTAG